MNKKKTILVVEDEKSIRQAMVDLLNIKGFTTLEGKNGEEGLKIALAEHPDLILLDVLMPDMDGMTMLKKVREDSWGRDVPVIILTNLNPADEQVIKDIVTNKPLHYFIKSDWNIHDIIKEINKVLDNPKA